MNNDSRVGRRLLSRKVEHIPYERRINIFYKPVEVTGRPLRPSEGYGHAIHYRTNGYDGRKAQAWRGKRGGSCRMG